ncbi:SMI1/KNR4 family protein [Pedobacter cryoconitis]|uniref:SUKH superfamily protein n=1 Tax=Pedobacter cryoconitis TaxID=188932 RepID=A0A327T8F4_9SPHI|nr:SMI1/KNR4 family protein [Pedobacter cryoconitis]RAJ37361.1 SUKH superfamily protein [Pedobacter cryoconitis]
MEIERFGEGDIKTIEELEDKSDIKLPGDYKDFLIKNNGARVNDGIFHVKALDENILLHIMPDLIVHLNTPLNDAVISYKIETFKK